MYRRYVIGNARATGIGSIVGFFIFCALVVWLIQFSIEIISGQFVELYRMPPT